MIQPCVCIHCRAHFVRRSALLLDIPIPIEAIGGLIAPVCLECGAFMCPVCYSHNIADIADEIIAVPPQCAASIRASVWGRGH